jgi:hypothetical protein
MATLTHCLSDAPLTRISITNGRMSANGLGRLLLSHSSTLRSLQLHYICFGARNRTFVMFKNLSASVDLDFLELFDLTQRGLEVARNRKALGICFRARGKQAVADLWTEFLACYNVPPSQLYV